MLSLAYWLKDASILRLYHSLIQLLVFNARRELKYARFHVENVSCKKRHFQHYEIIKSPEFANQIHQNLTKTMGSLAREMLVDAVWCVIHQDILYKSYIIRKVQLLPDRSRDNCLATEKSLLNKVKHQEGSGMLLSPPNEKNFA